MRGAACLLAVQLRFLVLAASVACAACAAVGGTMGSTAVTALATNAVAAGVLRAKYGDCVASCNQGTTCNRATGFCEPVSCSTRCPADLRCERAGTEDICVARPAAARDEIDREAPATASDAGADAAL